MSLIATSAVLTAFGLLVVGSTSPNAQASLAEPTLSFIPVHALLVDLCFVLLITFVVLCQTHHQWIAQNQSFPYSYDPRWNFGAKSFDFQLLIFEVFHVKWLSRTVHMVNIIIEEFLWLAIILGTFGNIGLATSLVILVIQSFSYGDISVGLVITSLNVAFGTTSFFVFNPWTPALALAMTAFAKIALSWVVSIRTLSHVLEPLPPTYKKDSRSFENSFGITGWRVCLTDLPLAIWLTLLGNISELGAGMPGRLFNPVIYKIMVRCGYRSKSILSVEEAKRQAWTIQDAGWMANAVTADMFAWADGKPGVGDLEKGALHSV